MVSESTPLYAKLGMLNFNFNWEEPLNSCFPSLLVKCDPLIVKLSDQSSNKIKNKVD